MFGGTSYAVTPQKRTNITSNFIRDVKRRSFKLSKTPRAGGLTDTSVISEKDSLSNSGKFTAHSNNEKLNFPAPLK